jgi:hypothetical protein
MMRTTPELLAKRVQLYLQPGERVQQAFLGRGGPSPMPGPSCGCLALSSLYESWL